VIIGPYEGQQPASSASRTVAATGDHRSYEGGNMTRQAMLAIAPVRDHRPYDGSNNVRRRILAEIRNDTEKPQPSAGDGSLG
jgi:hypothetical protein